MTSEKVADKHPTPRTPGESWNLIGACLLHLPIELLFNNGLKQEVSVSGPDLDVSEKNVIGGVDRFMLNTALAFLSVFPTLLALIATPWRFAALLTNDEPDGRRGLFLAPGVFFIASVTVTMLAAGLVATPGTIEVNSGLIGPAYSKSVSAAVASGDAWLVASLIGPIYALAVLIGGLARGFGSFVGPNWTLKASLRASFYQMAASICWIIASSTLIDSIGLAWGRQIAEPLYIANAVPTLLLPVWLYFWFFRRVGDVSIARAALLASVVFIMIAISILFVGSIS